MGAHSRAVKISIVINILTSTVRGHDPTLATYEATRPSLPKARGMRGRMVFSTGLLTSEFIRGSIISCRFRTKDSCSAISLEN
jgi:hypothetical protein